MHGPPFMVTAGSRNLRLTGNLRARRRQEPIVILTDWYSTLYVAFIISNIVRSGDMDPPIQNPHMSRADVHATCPRSCRHGTCTRSDVRSLRARGDASLTTPAALRHHHEIEGRNL